MTWTKLSDDFTDDTWTLSDAAHRLHVDGLVWSNRKLLDVHIPKADLARVSPRAEVVPELLDAGFWRDDGDFYVIRHHADYQRTREQVIHQQEANKKNRAKGRARPVREQFDQPSDESSNHSSDERDRTGLVWKQKQAPTEVETCAAAGCSNEPRHGLVTCYDHAADEIELYRDTFIRT